MSIPALAPGVQLANLLAACESYCVHECCGIDAFQFSPLRIATHLSGVVGSIEQEQVQRLLDDLSELLRSAEGLVPNELGFVCSVAGTNQNFSTADLNALVTRIRWAIEAAPALLDLSDRLEEEFDRKVTAP